MDDVAQTIAIYETDDLKRKAFGVADERAYRHGGGSNIAFADGHIKWCPQGQEPHDKVNFNPQSRASKTKSPHDISRGLWHI